MSAASCIVFIGVRLELDPQDFEALEARTDVRFVAARAAKLDTFWRGPSDDDPDGAMFVGLRLGVLGPEDQMRICIPADELAARIADARRRMLVAGFDGPLALHIEWISD